jgi:hypothetical protein
MKSLDHFKLNAAPRVLARDQLMSDGAIEQQPARSDAKHLSLAQTHMRAIPRKNQFIQHEIIWSMRTFGTTVSTSGGSELESRPCSNDARPIRVKQSRSCTNRAGV